MTRNKLYCSASEVAELLDVSVGAVYKLFRSWNQELAAKNYLVIAGKIPVKFFKEKIYGGNEYEMEVQDG